MSVAQKVEKIEDLVEPRGFKLLIALPPEKETVGDKNLIIAPDDLRKREHTASIVGNVVAMGSEAYLDQVKFPKGPWCAIGDWILMKSYTGIRFKIRGQEFRLINDDSVDAVVADPRLIERA